MKVLMSVDRAKLDLAMLEFRNCIEHAKPELKGGLKLWVWF